jgi:hypothetical protein
MDRRLLVLAIALVLTACGGNGTRDTGGSGAVVTRDRITLTAEAERRLDVKTAAVAQTGAQTTIPYSAVLYSADGRTWAYVDMGARTFVRKAIAVDRIEGDRAFLASGPAAGTRVATVGVSELRGIELGAGS